LKVVITVYFTLIFMVKNIAYFPSQAARNAPPVLEAALCGLRHHGIAAIENSLDADAALIWSVLWQGRMRNNQTVYEHYRSLGKPVLIIDIGCLDRGRTWKIALNHVTAQGYYGHTQHLDPSRPSRLGVQMCRTTPNKRHDAILIACQHAASLQVEKLCSQAGWAQQFVDQIRCHTDRPIVIRAHPRSPLTHAIQGTHVVLQQPKLLANTYDSFDLDFNFHAVVNHNSGPGIQAAVHGTPVVVHDSSLAYPVSISMSQIGDPPQRDRARWFLEICHTEWLLEEIAQGAWITRLGLAS